MTYVFSLYWRPAFHVHFPGQYSNYRMIVCLLVNGVTSEILSYSITFGDPVTNVHQIPVVRRNGGLLIASVNALRRDYKNHVIRFENDSLRKSLRSVRRSRSPFNGDFELRWLRNFYDWHRQELEQVVNPYKIMLGTLKQMLERAICRMNKETFAHAV